MDTLIFYLIAGAVYVFSMGVQQTLRATYARWSRVPGVTGRTGGQAARTILDANGLSAIPVQPVQGTLTDHYDPRHKQLRLSRANFLSPSVAAVAVSAHECGHAIQDEENYRPMVLRQALVPIANAGARFGMPLAILGSMSGSSLMVQLGVLAFGGSLLITFVTLPVEFNASRRALAQLERLGLVTADGRDGARKVLRAAAMTYVASVASSAGYLIYLVIVLGQALVGRREAPLPPRL